jgi:hypothetical protein
VSSRRLTWGRITAGISTAVTMSDSWIVYLAVAGERGAWTFKVWRNAPLANIAEGSAPTKAAAQELAEIAALAFEDLHAAGPATRPDDGDRFDSDPAQRPYRADGFYSRGMGGAE